MVTEAPSTVRVRRLRERRSRGVAMVASVEVGEGVTASHCVAMHSYNNAYAYRMMGWIERSKLNVTANPFDNIILQAREDSYPKRRGMTRVKELLQAGVNVGIGHDSIMDPWYPLGRGDMVEAASLTLQVCQMSGVQEIDTCFDMITWRNAQNLGLENYGVTPGANADLVVFDAASKADVLRHARMSLNTAAWLPKPGRLRAW